MSDIVERLRGNGQRAYFGDGAIMYDAAAEIERLRAALRFYAEPWKYTDCHGDDVRVPDFYSELDFGETARAALATGGDDD